MPKEPLIYIVSADNGMTAAFKTKEGAEKYVEYLNANDCKVLGGEGAYLYDSAEDAIG
jgi:hypothetical protein